VARQTRTQEKVLKEIIMAILRIYKSHSEYQDITDSGEITKLLAGQGIKFEKWSAGQNLAVDATPEDVMKAYNAEISRLKQERGFTDQDVIAIHPEFQGHETLRRKFLNEHTHTDDEARFFVDGSGLFMIHNDAGFFGLLCEKGDLVNVPKGTKHWFDMGAKPHFKCIRVFTNQEGWIGHFTGDAVSEKYPDFDQFMSGLKK
jgi:1,2-dihydroxy-3-keto-5-methylthiopentene dioxygenase